MIPDPTLFMSMLKDKESVVKSILADLQSCDANMKAFQSLTELYETSPAEVSTEKALKACAKSLRHLNDVNRRLLLVLLTYVAGGDFSTDAAKVLMKFGQGDEALREIMRQKMSGN